MKSTPPGSGLLRIEHPVPIFRYPLLADYPHLLHAVFTRHGGVSHPPYDRLNTSYEVGDHPSDVTANLAIIKKVLGADRLMYMQQVHGTHILSVRAEDMHNSLPATPADAVITDVPGLGLLVKQADCQGVILFDPHRSIVAVAHCGWRGNVANILSLVVARMKSDFGCDAGDLLACIGPSLGPCCAEFLGHDAIFPPHFKDFRVNETHFDLKAISRCQLLGAGLRDGNIQVSDTCTKCATDLFYSYRGEGKTGRFAAVAMLREGEPGYENVH
jgi:polyphenol oxidase